MATKIIQFQDKDGNVVNFEVYEPAVSADYDGMALAGGSVAQTAKDVVQGVKQSFEEAFEPLKTATTYIRTLLDEAEPAEVEVSFGIKINSELGAVIAKFGG